MAENRIKYFITLIVALPAVLIGAIAMGIHDVPSRYYLFNIGCLLLGWLISCFAIAKKTKIRKKEWVGVVSIILILVLYALTFLDLGIEQVHRWLSLGPLSIHISSIFAPLLIRELWTLKENKNDVLVAVFTILAAFLLVLQPDASQLTAFAIPMMMILFYKKNNRIYAYSLIGVLSVLVITSWIFLDTLPPVTYVEEILALVMDMGLIWSILGILSLILIPLPFFLFPMPNRKVVSRCLGLYFAIVIITTFFGNFPVPVMGYGISPIIGYLMAITWLMKHSRGEIVRKNSIL